ncbi:MAG: tetratricopeptide repeat protein [Thermoplasmata archaeon]
MQPALHPDESLLEVAELAARGRRWEEALSLLDRVLEAAPALERAHILRCGILRALDRRSEAVASAEAFASALPGSARAHHELGVCLSAAGRYEESVEAFRRALELDPKLLEAWKWMGIALGRMGRLEEAFRCYERASGRAPELSVPVPSGPAPSGLETRIHELMTGMMEKGGGCVRVETDPALTFRTSVLLLSILLRDWDMDGVLVSLGRPADVYRRALAARVHTRHPPHFVEVVAGGPSPEAEGAREWVTSLSAFEPDRIDAAVRAGLQKVAEMYGGEEHFVIIDDITAMEFYNGREVVRRFVAGFLGELSLLNIFCFVVVPTRRALELLGLLPFFCRERICVRAEWLRE